MFQKLDGGIYIPDNTDENRESRGEMPAREKTINKSLRYNRKPKPGQGREWKERKEEKVMMMMMGERCLRFVGFDRW